MNAVQALLTDEPAAIHDLACRVYGVEGWDDLTRAQVETIRRACKRLAQLGRAELQMRPARQVRPVGMGKAQGRGSSPRFLSARTPRTAEDRERDRQRILERMAALRHES